MPKYANGRIPESELIIFKRGWNSTDGDWYHGLPPATYARHLALIKRALDRTGRTLSPGDGWTTNRPYHAQEIARRIWGNGAAVPGTSSHGGFWEGRDTMAVDYSNWAWVYQNHGGQGSFFADCRAVGLTPGMIMRSRGYPDEPWHVIDLDPWGAVPQFAGVFTPFEPAREPVKEKPRWESVYALLGEAMNDFYFVDVEGQRPFRYFSRALGKSRAISRDEWEGLRAIERGSVPKEPLEPHIRRMSAYWYDKYVAFGSFSVHADGVKIT